MYPTVMLRQDKICFRLSDPNTKGISKWSGWLSEDELEHPESVVEQVGALLVYLGYAPDVDDNPSLRSDVQTALETSSIPAAASLRPIPSVTFDPRIGR
jgi:hypothetical protein